MRVYFNTRHGGAIGRVVCNLERYLSQDMERELHAEKADLLVLHITGRCRRAYELVRELGKPYAIIQYVLRSCANSNTRDWMELWKGARVVWSYYDLPAKIAEDGYSPLQFNFYRAPLGVDTGVFYPEQAEKKYMVGTMGGQYRAENIVDPWRAAKSGGGRVAHVGILDKPQKHIDHFQGISDQELRGVYSQCKYFSALRRYDGLEICAAEALLCGAIPILYDRPDFRYWFSGLAEFVSETETQKDLENLFREEKKVSQKDIEEGMRRFDWERIISGFWEQC